jgi:hypothetical protein
VEYRALGAHLDLAAILQTPGAMAEHMGSLHLMRRVLVPILGELTDAMIAHLRAKRWTALVAHPLLLSASAACEVTKTPLVCSSLAPISWMNPNDLPSYSALDRTWPPALLCKVNLFAGRLVMRLALDGAVNEVRRGLGLARTSEAWYRHCRDGVLNLGMWSTSFRGPHPGDPPTGVITGFPWFDRARGHEDDLAAIDHFLDSGEPPLVFTLGTASVHVAGNYFKAAARAAEIMGCRAMLVAGKREYFPPSLPSNAKAFTYAPYSRVFPRALLNVHHGGIGTTAQALRAGRPQVVTPMSHDQFDNSARVKRLGVGLRVRHKECTGEVLADHIRRTLADPECAHNAAELGPRIAREDGAARAARELEYAMR